MKDRFEIEAEGSPYPHDGQGAPSADAQELKAIVEAHERVRAMLADRGRIAAMREVLEELRDYFADKADVKDGEFGPIPDQYMAWEIKIRQALGEQI